MPEYPRTELLIKALGPMLTGIVIAVGIIQFGREQRFTRQQEFARNVWQEQLATYRKLAVVAGEIASVGKDRTRFERATQDFDVLYWGLMVFVEDTVVERNMIDMRTEILDYREGLSSEDRLKGRADLLLKAARVSLERNWRQLSTVQ